jgi:threonine dehydrogenase-like Zn-dependent dehydrogenase
VVLGVYPSNFEKETKMRGIWLENKQLSFRDDIPKPDIQDGECLIRPSLVGICSTDLELVKGYYPYKGILGHEFVGEVVEAPGNPDIEGKRVVGEINLVCGKCAHCRGGRSSHCTNRTVLGIAGHDGVFADYFTLPVDNLHFVSELISDEKAVFTEPLAAALRIQEQIHIDPDNKVLVIGAGRLGQLVSQTLLLTGCDLTVVARYQNQQDLLENRGIRVIDEDQISQGSMDIVVDTTGNPKGFEASRSAVRSGGKIIMKSTYAGKLEFDASAVVVDEITLLGSRCGPFAPALNLLEEGKVDPTPMISEYVPLENGIEAFNRAGGKGILKILLSF